MDIDLKDLKPEDVEIVLDGRSFVLRKFNLSDEAWLRETFGDSDQKLFGGQMSFDDVCRIAFHQLSDKDRALFAISNVKLVDEEGNEYPGKIGGWKAFRALAAGPEDKLNLFKAIMMNVGISRPLMDKMFTKEEREALKLSPQGSKKKKPIGRKSLRP